MMDHSPPIGSLLKNIRRQDRGGNHLPFNGAVDILVERYPSQRTSNLNRNVAKQEVDFRCVFEDSPPTRHYRIPARQKTPTWMATLDRTLLNPNLFHLLDIEALERPIEILVGLRYFLFFLSHTS